MTCWENMQKLWCMWMKIYNNLKKRIVNAISSRPSTKILNDLYFITYLKIKNRKLEHFKIYSFINTTMFYKNTKFSYILSINTTAKVNSRTFWHNVTKVFFFKKQFNNKYVNNAINLRNYLFKFYSFITF